MQMPGDKAAITVLSTDSVQDRLLRGPHFAMAQLADNVPVHSSKSLEDSQLPPQHLR